MSDSDKRDTPQDDQQKHEPARADIPEHMKPENLEKLRDYGKDAIPPGVA